TAPTRYGPQPAPAGPIPSAWLAGGAVAGPTATTVQGPSLPSTPGPAAPAPTTGGGLDTPMVVVGLLAVLIVIGLVVAVVVRRGRQLPSGGPDA
ncbi:MAG: hypothetical protein ACXWXA_06120, partial [Candidatus Limnocylindrales bacterium]